MNGYDNKILRLSTVLALILCVQLLGASPAQGVAPARVTVSGKVTFDRVPHSPGGVGLNYSAIKRIPVRGAVVQAISAASGVAIAATATNSAGGYLLAVPARALLFIRVRAQSRRVGVQFWNFRVVDNTSNKALYVMDGARFNSGVAASVRNLHAASGWNGTAYAGPRVAAPFAILDSVYVAFNKVLKADASSRFPPLTLNWSARNRPAFGNRSLGNIGTSFYANGELYVLGAANSDTDEYDDHVLIHEWGHYFEDKFSRADNIGGPHGLGESLDIRVAFGEGWGNAWSGIATDDPIYSDTIGPRQSRGFTIDLENNSDANPGSFSEASVQSILFDIYDRRADGSDSLGLGFAPIYSVLVNQQRITRAATSIYSFIAALKATRSLGERSAIDALMFGQQIAGIGIWGIGEINDTVRNDARVPPVYGALTIGAGPIRLCGSNDFGLYNKQLDRRLINFQVGFQANYRINVTGGVDPDFIVHRAGRTLARAQSARPAGEALTINLAPGVYILELCEFANVFLNGVDACHNVIIQSL